MLTNYFKIAFRQLKRNKGFSFLNIAGLSLGIAAAILILLWVNDEFSYNRFHKNYSRLYQVMENQAYEGKTYTYPALPGKFAPAIKQELPEIKHATRVDWGARTLFSLGDKSIYERGFFVDPDFLRMFSFNILKGDTTGLLGDPGMIIISDKMAERFFGNDEALGKTLKFNNDKPYTVAAIIEEPSQLSTFEFSWLISFKVPEANKPWLQDWGTNGTATYVELNEGADPDEVDKKLNNFIVNKDTGSVARPFLLAMSDWRLKSEFKDGKQAGGQMQYVRLFIIIAILIIGIACINFMNLSTARSEQRAREVGVRKAMGAGRSMLIRQFFSESILMSLFAMLLAALIIVIALPAFNTLVEKKLIFDFSNPVIWAGLPLIALICGVVSGSYPSLYLSSFNPVTVFKGLRIGKNSAIVFARKSLVIAQFVISIGLIISTIIIYNQLNHVKNRDLGYNKDTLRGDMKQHIPAIQSNLVATGVVENAAASNNRVLQIGSSSSDFNWKGKASNADLLISMDWVSPSYISTMGMKLKSGRDFNNDIASDSNNIIINETFARHLGKEDVVGDIITTDSRGQLTIVGVVKDFVFTDMYKTPDPLILFCDTSIATRMMIRLKEGENAQEAIAKVGSVIKSHSPAYPFEYKFVDEDFNNLFKREALIGKLSRLFAFLTILISCLGLFGLAAHTAERRTKEIGIRKVLGATVPGVIALLSKEFVGFVIIASLIAFPLAWWVMHKFLQDYEYRIQIEWWVFAASALLAIAIALFTVSFQAIKAAITNPVKSLRTE
jgi:putative ABC transport system permease protein